MNIPEQKEIPKMPSMRKWTEDKLIEAGYSLENARITNIDLTMEDHGCLCLSMVLEGNGWGCIYGGYSLGHGYVGADDDYFSGSAKGMESIIRVMDTVGCSRFNELKGRYVRAAIKGTGARSIRIIGNIIKDKWFDEEDFFKEE